MSKKRTIFQEFSDNEKPTSSSSIGIIAKSSNQKIRSITQLWLKALFTLIVLIILVGGLTRLTDSGLSITEWKPITGALPPFSAESWFAEFSKYKQIPEYKLQNEGMSLSEFKFIYWWEWGHRQLGRVIGLVWFFGFISILTFGRIQKPWSLRLLLIGVLIGIQGTVGWWMVSSGLTGTVLDVASYRLATHLGLAFIILGYITWFILLLGRSETLLLQARRNAEPKFILLTTGLLHLTFLQILFGALVAGIDAGTSYTDWPLMAGQIFPPDLFYLIPWWRNFFEDPGLVQFVHRVSGYVLFIFCVYSWLSSRKSGNLSLKFSFNLVFATAFLQMILGITTVVYASPWESAIVHQFGAILLWIFVLRARFLSKYPTRNVLSN